MSELHQQVVSKLEPVRVSGKFRAILGCLLSVRGWSDPELAELYIASDGHLLGRVRGDIGLNELLGHADDLRANLRGVSEVAGLEPPELNHLMRLAGRLDRRKAS